MADKSPLLDINDMARYGNINTAASSYGTSYRQGLKDMSTQAEKATQGLVDFAGDIYNLVEKERKRKAEQAEAEAMERQREAQREMWKIQAEQESARISLQGRKLASDALYQQRTLGLKDKELGLAGKRLKIEGQKLEQSEAELNANVIHRRKIREQDQLEHESDVYFKKLDAVTKSMSKFKTEEEFRKWKLGSRDDTIKQYRIDIQRINKGMVDSAANPLMMKALLKLNKDYFPSLDGVDDSVIDDMTPEQLINVKTPLTQDQYLAKQVKPGYTPRENPYLEIHASLLANKRFSPIPEGARESLLLRQEIESQKPKETSKVVLPGEDETPVVGSEEKPETIVSTKPGLFDEILSRMGEETTDNVTTSGTPAPVEISTEDEKIFENDFFKENPYYVMLDDDKQEAVALVIESIGAATPNTEESSEELLRKFNSLKTFRSKMADGDFYGAMDAYLKTSTGDSLNKSPDDNKRWYVNRIFDLLSAYERPESKKEQRVSTESRSINPRRARANSKPSTLDADLKRLVEFVFPSSARKTYAEKQKLK